jgi:acyl-CoA synthetase (AMP-forming)/AMP-acid ligase II
VLDRDGVHHKWFLSARTNITINALDRHANSELRNRAAFIWLGEDGSERIVTYGQLHRQVCRFANGLKSLVVSKGDRVIISMPLQAKARSQCWRAPASERFIASCMPDLATRRFATALPTRKPRS